MEKDETSIYEFNLESVGQYTPNTLINKTFDIF